MKNLSRFRWTDGEPRGPAARAIFKSAELTLRALRDYHQHEVFGLENIPRTGPALIACNHSFATYDGWFFGVVLRDELGRRPLAIGDRLMMGLPVVGPFFRELGFVLGSRESAAEMLRRGEILGLLPGGMREALRSSNEKYRINWQGRRGFVWASMLSGAPVVLAACPRADDIFDVADLDLTRRIYDRFRVPVALVRGLGPTVLPRPVKLWHLVSEPIFPDVAPDRVAESDVARHHEHLMTRMDRLMRDALELDTAKRAAGRLS
jgi:1-acyl-sn-glycerol-3-phosphate acyltransferase